MKVITKKDYRRRRHFRIRAKISGTAARPRMAVFRSNQNLYVQFIDDDAQRTLAQVSTRAGKESGKRTSVEQARELGGEAAKVAKDQGISNVVFDRSGFSYSGKIKALAEGARAAGLTL